MQDATSSTIDVPHELTIILVRICLLVKYVFKFNQDFYDIDNLNLIA